MSSSSELVQAPPSGRLLRVVWTATMASSFLSCVVTAMSIILPLSVYDGWTLSGQVGLAGSNIRAFGEPVRFPPLESVSRIALLLAILSILSPALAMASVLLRALGRTAISLEVATASAVAVALSSTLLYSVLRVVVWDIMPQLEATRILYSTAGKLLLNPPTVTRSLVSEFYARHGELLAVWGAVSLGLAAALYRYRLRLEAAAAPSDRDKLSRERLHGAES